MNNKKQKTRKRRLLKIELKKINNHFDLLLQKIAKGEHVDKQHLQQTSKRFIELSQKVYEKPTRKYTLPNINFDPPLSEPLQEINNKYIGDSKSLLKCPLCGAPDRGNTQNGKPYCFTCNVEMTNEGKSPTRTVSPYEMNKKWLQTLTAEPRLK